MGLHVFSTRERKCCSAWRRDAEDELLRHVGPKKIRARRCAKMSDVSAFHVAFLSRWGSSNDGAQFQEQSQSQSIIAEMCAWQGGMLQGRTWAIGSYVLQDCGGKPGLQCLKATLRNPGEGRDHKAHPDTEGVGAPHAKKPSKPRSHPPPPGQCQSHHQASNTYHHDRAHLTRRPQCSETLLRRIVSDPRLP